MGGQAAALEELELRGEQALLLRLAGPGLLVKAITAAVAGTLAILQRYHRLAVAERERLVRAVLSLLPLGMAVPALDQTFTA
jgi:hypothetical protein